MVDKVKEAKLRLFGLVKRKDTNTLVMRYEKVDNDGYEGRGD